MTEHPIIAAANARLAATDDPDFDWELTYQGEADQDPGLDPSDPHDDAELFRRTIRTLEARLLD